MTDQTTPEVTDEDRRIARDWAAHIISAPFTSMPMEAAAARVILHDVPAPPPKRPTLADMTPEEREACVGMWADVSGYSQYRGIIHEITAPRVPVFRPNSGGLDWCDPEEVTPRPDLPRAWNRDGTMPPVAPAAPALPEGWRLADHPEHGRVIVTTPEPDDSGDVEFACHAPEGIRGGWFGECLPDELTFLDGANYRALAERNDEKVC